MASVAEDVYLEILARVPVKTALICKCVCKSWFRIISNPSFVEMRQNMIIQKNNPGLVLRGFNPSSEITHKIYSIDYDTLLASKNGREVDVVELDYPFKSFGCSVKLLGSSNGLFCLSYSNIHISGWDKFFCVWNPATKEFIKLPKSPYEKFKKLPELPYQNGVFIHGFAYDSKIDDYKLILVRDFDGGKIGLLVEVYTLGTDSWKSGQTVTYTFRIGSGLHFNGALHWFGGLQRYTCEIIIFLDVSSEKFQELQLPKKLLKDEHLLMTLGVLERCLCVLVKVKVGLEVWVMKGYGVRESWTKHLSIDNERVRNFDYMWHMWSFRDGKILIRTHDDKLVLYDAKNSSAREMNFSRLKVCQADFFVESLASLNSNTYVGVDDRTTKWSL